MHEYEAARKRLSSRVFPVFYSSPHTHTYTHKSRVEHVNSTPPNPFVIPEVPNARNRNLFPAKSMESRPNKVNNWYKAQGSQHGVNGIITQWNQYKSIGPKHDEVNTMKTIRDQSMDSKESRHKGTRKSRAHTNNYCEQLSLTILRLQMPN